MSETMTEQTTPSNDSKTRKKSTAYVILRRLPETPDATAIVGWAELGEIESTNAKNAVLKFSRDTEAEDGLTYMAIPKRSWVEHTTVRETRIRIS